MKSRLIAMAGLLLMGTMSGYGDVVQGWDLGSGNTTAVPAGWTTWNNDTVVTVGASSTVGGLTLTYTSGGPLTLGNTPGTTPMFNSAPLLLAGNNGVFRDSVLLPSAPATTVFTLSGLTAGRTYEIQFTGQITAAAGGTGTRNIAISKDGAAAVNVLTTPQATDTWFSSPIFTFVATSGDLDTAFTLTKVNAGNSGISGIIVNTIPEPATMGLLGATGFMLLWLRRRFMV